MNSLLLVCLLGYVGLASGQLVKCEGVWRNANDCPKGRVSEQVQVYTPPPAAAAAGGQSGGSVAEQMRAKDAATMKKLMPQPRSAADKASDARIKERGDRAAKHPNLPSR